MEGILSQAKSIFSLKKYSVDNGVYKLFYKFSFGMFMIGAAFAGATQYFGSPIKCYQNNEKINNGVFEAHCWLHGSGHVEGNLSRESKCISNLNKDKVIEKFFVNWQQIPIFFYNSF